MVMIMINANGSQARKEAQITRQAFEQVAAIVTKTQTELDTVGKKGASALSQTEKSAKGLAGAIGGIAMRAAALGGALFSFKAFLDAQIAMQRLEKAYQSVFGDGTRAQLDFIHEQTARVSLDFVATAEAAKSFFAAGKDTTIAPELNNIFNAVTNAAGALQLSTEQTNGVFIALGQMMSKGKVQAEELRGQLGERLPGAFQMAAQAMNMTTAELDKFMADGKLTAEDLLPRLADVLQNKFAAAAAQAANTAQGAINRMTSEWEIFKASVLDSDTIVAVLNEVTDVLERRNEASALAKEREALAGQLQGMGIGPDQQNIDYGFMGEQHVTSNYSDEMLNWMRNMNAGWQAENEMSEQNAKQTEKVLADGRKAIEDALKETPQWQKESLGREKEVKLSAIREMIEAYKAEGVSVTQLEQQLSAVAAEYDRKISEAGKKANKGSNRKLGFTSDLEKLRQEVANMEATLNPAAIGLDKVRQKLELERQNAISTAEAHAKLAVQRKQATSEQASEMVALETKKAELTYTQKLSEAEERGRQTRVSFYQELAKLSGDSSLSLRGQAEAVNRLATEYRSAGISEELVRQWQTLKQIETARDPFSGMLRGMRQWAAEATDLASQFQMGFTSAMDQTSDVLTDFVLKGEADFSRLGESMARMFVKMMIQATMARMIMGIFGGGGFGGGVGGGFFGFAQGGVMSGGNLSNYRNTVVTSPTMFTYGNLMDSPGQKALRPFATGAGLMGEAGPEAIMPLTRMPGGELGVRAIGKLDHDWPGRDLVGRRGVSGNSGNGSGSEPTVNVVINNNTSAEVTQQTRTDNRGNRAIEITVGDMVAGQAMKPGSTMNRALRAATGAQQQATRR